LKARGVRSPEDWFAHALATAENDLGADGRSDLRTDTPPAKKRTFLTKV
jgi:hypothetical protein